MDNYWMEINEHGKLHYVYKENDGTRSIYEVLGFKSDNSLNTKFLYKVKPKEDGTQQGEK